MVTVKLFGMTKLLAGNQGSLSLALTNGRRVKDLVELLDGGYPAIGALIHTKKVLVSVNQEIAHEDMEIRDGDEIALLPPFAGGSPQDVETGHQLRSRVAQGLNVPQGYASRLRSLRPRWTASLNILPRSGRLSKEIEYE
jgi:molybdopterin synthase sulfur carrier subunit